MEILQKHLSNSVTDGTYSEIFGWPTLLVLGSMWFLDHR